MKNTTGPARQTNRFGFLAALLLSPACATAGAPFALTQTIRAEHGGQHAAVAENAFFSGEILRMETLDAETGALKNQFLLLPAKETAYSLDQTECSAQELSAALPRRLLARKAGAFSSWNSLSASKAQIEPVPDEDTKTCRAYSISMDFKLSNFVAKAAHSGSLTGKVWICQDPAGEGAVLAQFDKFYRDSSESLLNPLDYAVFDIGDVSSNWAVMPENAERIAREVLDGLALIKGTPMRWELEWQLPTPPSRELLRASFPDLSTGYPRRHFSKHSMPAQEPAPDAVQTLSIRAEKRFLTGKVKISHELFRLPPACAGDIK